jgi:hypothetical protein
MAQNMPGDMYVDKWRAGSEVFTAADIQLTPCSLVVRYQRYEGAYSLPPHITNLPDHAVL